MRKILIIGATSAIAEACARHWATRGDALFLIARNLPRVNAVADDLRVRGSADVGVAPLDVNDIDAHEAAIQTARVAMGGIDIALIAHGTLPDQNVCDQDIQLTLREFETNASSSIALMQRLASLFQEQGHGHLAVISSVAGDRGRASNAIYGAAKAAVSSYASALRQRLAPLNIPVLTIKPGFVETPMTARFAKGRLWSSPDRVAAGIVRAIDRNRSTIYLPWFWRPIMAVVRMLPEIVFKRTRF